jgi:hypothetical protein
MRISERGKKTLSKLDTVLVMKIIIFCPEDGGDIFLRNSG